MTITLLEREPVANPAKLSLIDCDIHPTAKSTEEFRPFMSRRWWEHLTTYGSGVRQGFKDMLAHPRMQEAVSRGDTWPPNGGPPGSDLDFMRKQHLDAYGIDVGNLIPLRQNAGSQRNLEYGAALCRAVNDWEIDKFCRQEPRLRASIVVPCDDPDSAIAEIDRCANDPRFAQVLFPVRTSEPVGRKRYWPIFEAAAAAGRPIAVHVGGVSGFPVGAGTGWLSYYLEEYQSQAQPMQAMIVSLVAEGVFERIPGLKLIMIEGGFAWVPSLGWRLDKHWKRLRSEVPHVKRLPSEYIREHFWYTTQPIEEPERPEDLKRTMEWVGVDHLLFSTDYPHWDFDDPNFVFRVKLSESDRTKIFSGNAKALFNLA